MATDFFDRQDHARRQTWRLIVLFTLSLVAIIIAIYLVVAVGLASAAMMAASVELRRGEDQIEVAIGGKPFTTYYFKSINFFICTLPLLSKREK